jgi:hypothetical protein
MIFINVGHLQIPMSRLGRQDTRAFLECILFNNQLKFYFKITYSN